MPKKRFRSPSRNIPGRHFHQTRHPLSRTSFDEYLTRYKKKVDTCSKIPIECYIYNITLVTYGYQRIRQDSIGGKARTESAKHYSALMLHNKSLKEWFILMAEEYIGHSNSRASSVLPRRSEINEFHRDKANRSFVVANTHRLTLLLTLHAGHWKSALKAFWSPVAETASLSKRYLRLVFHLRFRSRDLSF